MNISHNNLAKKGKDSVVIDIDRSNKKDAYQRTKDQLQVGSWCEENKQLSHIFLATSYFAALISLSSAFFWVFDSVNIVIDNAAASYVIGALALVLLEVFDRISSKKVWHSWFFFREINYGWIIPAIGIFAGSLFLSVDGEQAAKETAKASPQTIATNALLEEKKAEKAELQAKYDAVEKDPKSYKTPKLMWWPTQQQQKARQSKILTLSDEIAVIQEEIKGENHLLAESHIIKVEKIGNVFLGIVILFALLYQFCIAYLSYYDRKQYNEGQLREQLSLLHQQGTTITPALATRLLKEIEQPLKRKFRIELF